MTKYETVKLGPYRNLSRGDEASVQLPGRKTRVRARFLWADHHGLTFADPRNGGARTIYADAVGTIHRSKHARSPSSE